MTPGQFFAGRHRISANFSETSPKKFGMSSHLDSRSGRHSVGRRSVGGRSVFGLFKTKI